jgi:hypothetical protein
MTGHCRSTSSNLGGFSCVKRTFMLKSFACVSKSTLLRGELLVHFQIYLRNSITYEYETKVFWISTTRAHLSIKDGPEI